MSAIFPKWTNRLPLMIIVGSVLVGGAVTAGMWYYLTPKYSRVGYPCSPLCSRTRLTPGNWEWIAATATTWWRSRGIPTYLRAPPA
jgi:hypothetical protein